MRFFFFGTLMDPDVMAAVIGHAPDHHVRAPARLVGYRRVQVAGETAPMLAAASGTALDGLLVEGLRAPELDRILFFESVEYQPREVSVTTDAGTEVAARVFLSGDRADPRADPWVFSEWQIQHKAQSLREAAIWMGLYGHVDIVEAERLWDQALATGQALDDMVAAVRRGAHRSHRSDTAESA